MTHLDTNTWEYGPVDKGINRMHHSIGISVRGSDAAALDFLYLNRIFIERECRNEELS